MNIVAVEAHQDDIEISCLGTLIKYTLRGDVSITNVSISNGDKSAQYDLSMSYEEVAAMRNAEASKVAEALGVVYDSQSGNFETYREADVEGLLAHLDQADLVIGFNVLRFDYRVLRGYTDRDLAALPTFDLLDAIHARLGFRVALGHLGEETLGRGKSGDGLQSLRWWKEGRVAEIESYCRDDVALLRDLFDHVLASGHLMFRTRGGERVRLPLAISLEELVERGRESGSPP